MARKNNKLPRPDYQGLSGAQIGQKKLEEFESWAREVEIAGTKEDWRGKFSGTVSRGKIATKGLGWKTYTPFHQNERLREAVCRVEKKWFGGPDKQPPAEENTSPDSSKKSVQRASVDSNCLAKRVSELEAEVRMLRALVQAYEEQRDLIAGGVPGFCFP